MGQGDSALPQVIYPASEQLSKRNWRYSKILVDHFWSQFVRDYLPTLQPRQKWHCATTPLAIGQVVMMIDPQVPRAFWPMGQVISLFPGTDSMVRSAEIQVKDRLYARPVARLVPLPEIPDTSKDKSSGLVSCSVKKAQDYKPQPYDGLTSANSYRCRFCTFSLSDS